MLVSFSPSHFVVERKDLYFKSHIPSSACIFALYFFQSCKANTTRFRDNSGCRRRPNSPRMPGILRHLYFYYALLTLHFFIFSPIHLTYCILLCMYDEDKALIIVVSLCFAERNDDFKDNQKILKLFSYRSICLCFYALLLFSSSFCVGSLRVTSQTHNCRLENIAIE